MRGWSSASSFIYGKLLRMCLAPGGVRAAQNPPPIFCAVALIGRGLSITISNTGSFGKFTVVSAQRYRRRFDGNDLRPISNVQRLTTNIQERVWDQMVYISTLGGRLCTIIPNSYRIYVQVIEYLCSRKLGRFQIPASRESGRKDCDKQSWLALHSASTDHSWL